ncbi:glutathione S-transferase family protein [Sphingomonas jatrophae]|uniref:GST-like protein n=1 Tax=Sphingomonas jatrophae TaxID=1166337 RepID=A0A1I6KEV9_9SPHN|nr:glutathione S-transferase N-terminal domain-containing protein [Sphingomonas jatrophae]SFR89771.1 GST-like protein [Sphingomonas jatrophae]
MPASSTPGAPGGPSDRVTLLGMSSPNVVKILIMLEEIGRPYRFEHVDLFAEGQFDDAFRALNPNSKVPVLLLEDGTPIFESGAILLYLAERHGALLPASGAERYAVLQWLVLQVSTVGPLLGQLNHFTTYAPEGQDYALGRYRREAHRIYAMLDERLAASPHLAGADYSIADVATLPWTDYIARQGLDPADYPAIARWRDALEARPAVSRARAFVSDIQATDRAMFKRSSEAARRRFAGFGTDEPAKA